MKTESIKNDFNDSLQTEFDEEIDNITKKCLEITNEIKKICIYENQYSTKLCQIVNSNHMICFPNVIKIEKLKKLGNNAKFDQQFKEVNILITKTKDEYNKTFLFIKERENNSCQIEKISSDANNKSIKFKNSDIMSVLTTLDDAEKQILNAEQIKKWDEKAEGYSITYYNNSMENAYKIINDKISIIESKINLYFSQLRQTIDQTKKDNMDEISLPEDTISKYKKGLDIIINEIEKLKTIFEIDEKMNLNRKSEIVEFSDELNQMKGKFERFISNFPNRVMEFVNEWKNKIIEIIQMQAQLKDELNDHNSNINGMEVSLIDQKGTFIMNKYQEILTNKTLIEKYIKEFNFNIEIPETKDAIDFYHSLSIIYKSTMLLSPLICSENIYDRIKMCSDSNFSLYMAVLYVCKFKEAKEFINIENISEAQNIIERKVQLNESFYVSISQKICNEIKTQSKNNVRLIILSDLLNYIPKYQNSFKYYIDVRLDYSSLNKLTKADCSLSKLNEMIKISNTKRISKNELKSNCDGDINKFVVDFGIGETRFGFAGEKCPRFIIPNYLCETFQNTGKYRLMNRAIPSYTPSIYIGKDAICDYINIRHIKSFNDDGSMNEEFFRKFLSELFSQTNYSSNDKSILLSMPYFNSEKKFDNLVEILFEVFDFESVFCINPCVLSLYSYGITTGTVVDIGKNETRICPIYENYDLQLAYRNLQMGGDDISQLLQLELKKNDKSNLYMDSIEEIKKKCCYAALDFEYEKYNYSSNHFHLSNIDKYIILEDEPFKSTEVLFDPSLNNHEFKGIPETINESILDVDADFRYPLYSNIVLSGSTTLIPGLEHRIEKNVNEISSVPVKVCTFPERKYASWIGGSIFATLNQEMFLSKMQYRENKKLDLPYHSYI